MTPTPAAPPVPDYAARRVLVLGATGFVGRWTACALHRAGAEVHVGARDPDRAEAALRASGAPVRAWRVDVSRRGEIATVLAAAAPSQVFNLAGYGVQPTERDPRSAERLNAEFVDELGEALSAFAEPPGGGPALVHTGSAAEYGEAGGDLRESGPELPTSLYGRTKLDGTRAIRRLALERGLRAVVARLFTVYGPGEPAGRLLPTLVEAARGGRPADLTAGTQRRDFIYVEDVAEGLVRLGHVTPPAGAVVNLATGELTTVRDFVLAAADVLGMPPGALRFGAIESTREEMQHDAASTERLVGLTRWKPTTPIVDGVRRTRELVARREGSW